MLELRDIALPASRGRSVLRFTDLFHPEADDRPGAHGLLLELCPLLLRLLLELSVRTLESVVDSFISLIIDLSTIAEQKTDNVIVLELESVVQGGVAMKPTRTSKVRSLVVTSIDS